MSADNMLVFRNHDPVGGSPTVDGYAMADIGVNTTEAEPGYINGGRVTIGASSGLPPVTVQAIKHGNTLVLGIMCRGDSSFDDVDGVVIALRPNGGSSTGPQRRIDIFPLWGDVFSGLNPNNLGTGHGAANPDLNNAALHLFEAPAAGTLASYNIQTDKPPHFAPTFYARTGTTGAWDPPYVPALGANTALYNVRARSWVPPVATNSPAEFAWSIEVRFPIDMAAGGSDWIDLADDFGLFVDVIRGWRFASGTNAYYLTAQFKFPLNVADLTGILDETTDIPAASFGHGLMNAAVTQGEGVGIANGEFGVGRRPVGNTTAAPDDKIDGTAGNDIVALIENTGPAASGVRAEVRMANFGMSNMWNPPLNCQNPSPTISLAAGSLSNPTSGVTVNSWNTVPSVYLPPHDHQCIWVQLDSNVGGVTFTHGSVRRNMTVVNLSSVTRDIEISGAHYGPPAGGGATHEFLLFTRCRRIVLRELFEGRRFFDSGIATLVAYALSFMRDAPRLERLQDLFSSSAIRALLSGQWRESVFNLVITEGFLVTGKFLTIKGIKTEVLDSRPCHFGLIAHHRGLADKLNWGLSGPGAVRYAPGVYGVQVPVDGKTTLTLKLASGPGEPAGDRSDLPKAPLREMGGAKPKPKKLSIFQRIARAIIKVVRRSTPVMLFVAGLGASLLPGLTP